MVTPNPLAGFNPETVAPVKVTLVRFAPVKLQFVRLAFVKLQPVKLTPVKSPFEISAPVRLAPATTLCPLIVGILYIITII